MDLFIRAILTPRGVRRPAGTYATTGEKRFLG